MGMRLSSMRKGHIHKDHRVLLCLQLIGSIIFAKYKILNYPLSFWLFSFKVGFDGSVLCVEVSHIDDEILQDEHVAQRSDD